MGREEKVSEQDCFWGEGEALLLGRSLVGQLLLEGSLHLSLLVGHDRLMALSKRERQRNRQSQRINGR